MFGSLKCANKICSLQHSTCVNALRHQFHSRTDDTTLHRAHSASVSLAMCAVLSLFQGSQQTKNTETFFVCTKYAVSNHRVASGVWKGKRQPLVLQCVRI